MSKKWWLISQEDVDDIRKGLEASTHDKNDYNCPDEWYGCTGCEGDDIRRDALHSLDSGLHITECVPDDFKGEV